MSAGATGPQVSVVSVVVPTRDRPGPLAACLAALERQTLAAFEIVVVDDASSDPGAVAAVVAAAPHARLVRGAGRGPAAARNRGAAAARAPILCFTDDDCRPDPGWAEALARRLGAHLNAPAGPHHDAVEADAGVHGRAGVADGAAVDADVGVRARAGVADGAGAHEAVVAAGPTRNGRPGDPYAAASQAITNHLTLASLDPATGHVAFAPTSNLACRAEIHRASPFDETYPLAAGEDREWCSRLADRGLAIAYEPAAAVDHHQDLSLRRFWRQQVRYGRGARRWQRDRPAGARLQPVRFYVGLLRAGFALGPAAGLLVVLAQVATAVGFAREVVVARRHRG